MTQIHADRFVQRSRRESYWDRTQPGGLVAPDYCIRSLLRHVASDGHGVATLWSFGGDQWRICSTLRAVASALPDDDVGDWFTLDGTLLCDSSRKE